MEMKSESSERGFTLIELLISVAIFVVMTALVVSKYGNFNQSTLLTDSAYDIALVLRTAQTYGLSVRNVNSSFASGYGIAFDKSVSAAACGNSAADSTHLVLFADTDTASSPSYCGASDADVVTYTITRGAVISNLCAGTEISCNSNTTKLSVTFRRPDPDAQICGYDGSSWACGQSYAEAALRGADGSVRTVTIRQNGQISVKKS